MPLRQCIGCGEMKSKKEMIRVLKTADDTIEIDATGRRNGRGAYLCPSMDCWKKAVKSKGLERSLKMAIPKEVYEALEKEMEQFGAMKKKKKTVTKTDLKNGNTGGTPPAKASTESE